MMGGSQTSTSGGPVPLRDSRPVQTDVSVYLGDCAGATLNVVCDGTSLAVDGSIWKHAADALEHPSPRGPYPVSSRFTIFVHQTLPDSDSDDRVLASIRIDVTCENNRAYATVRGTAASTLPTDFEPNCFSVGDDVVEIARAIFEMAS
jgi:hypothetical protein